MTYKVKETDTHIYFLTGPFSQWHLGKFKSYLHNPKYVPKSMVRDEGSYLFDEPEYEFNCAEQFMMANKARLFNDQGAFNDIMEAVHPRDQKQLGRLVQNFDPTVWNKHALDLVITGNWQRCLQNKEYQDAIVASGKKYLVEGNRHDPVWAVGLSWDDPAILDQANWKGTNWLGKAHMAVRDLLVMYNSF